MNAVRPDVSAIQAAFGVAQVTDLPGPDQVVQSRQSLLDRGSRIGRVELVQIDVIGAQTAQRRLDRAHDVAPGTARTVIDTVAPGHAHAELRRDHHVVPPSAQRRAELLLGAAPISVDIRGVEEVDPHVQSRVDDSPGARFVQLAAEIVATDADHRHDQPGFA
jgi:hypothetical protein